MKVEKAPAPTDVNFENLTVSTYIRMKRSLLTYTISLIVLGIAFSINYGLSKIKDDLDKDSKGIESSNAYGIRLISLGASFLVTIINIILENIIRSLSSYEKHETHTKFSISFGSKLLLATFINTGLIPL